MAENEITKAQFFKALGQYKALLISITGAVGIVFAYGVGVGKGSYAKEAERDSIRKDISIARTLLKESIAQQRGIADTTGMTYKSILSLQYDVTELNEKLDGFILNYKQSLKVNPGISKEQYAELTGGIDRLLKELQQKREFKTTIVPLKNGTDK